MNEQDHQLQQRAADTTPAKALPSKSATFVIHQIGQHQRAHGNGISVRVDGQPIEDIVFEDGCINIRSSRAEPDASGDGGV